MPWNRLETRWNEVQVGRQGAYSVERLESLDHYCKTTSPIRVFLVCVLTPLPALICALLLECLPLQPPSEEMAANWMFWIRLSLMQLVVGYVGVTQLVTFAPDLNFTLAKRLIVIFGVGGGYIGTILLAAHYIGFPIPFVWQVGSAPIAIYFPAMLVLVLGREPFVKSSPLRPQLECFLRFLFAYVAFIGAFPLYKFLYDSVPVRYRGCMVLVLPLWKLGSKHFIMRSIRELEDFIPEIVAFSVDFFSALFVSVCVSTVGSIYLSVLFIASDVGHAMLEFREVREYAKTVLELLLQGHQSFSGIPMKSRISAHSQQTELLTRILAVTRNPCAFQVKSLRGSRLWACLPHVVPDTQMEKLQALGASGLYDVKAESCMERKTPTKTPHHRSPHSIFVRSVQVAPAPTTVLKTSPHEPQVTDILRAAPADIGLKSQEFVQQSLKLLFHCEYLVLVEYVECIVPLVYTVFKSVLEHLPNVVYYPGGGGNWSTTSMRNLLVFSALEIGTLFLLHHFLRRNFAFSSLYQLAFVLETQYHLVQAKLFIEIVVLLQYQLVHFGVDFTFRFEWLASKKA